MRLMCGTGTHPSHPPLHHHRRRRRRRHPLHPQKLFPQPLWSEMVDYAW